MAVTVKASLGKEKFYTQVVAGENTLITDEPVDSGGQNKGFNPMEILATALASCTAATLRMYLERKKWDVEKINVEVHLDTIDSEKISNFNRTISFEGGVLDEKQIQKLHQIAERCPVHELLMNQINIQTLFLEQF